MEELDFDRAVKYTAKPKENATTKNANAYFVGKSIKASRPYSSPKNCNRMTYIMFAMKWCSLLQPVEKRKLRRIPAAAEIIVSVP